jgi:tetratricopeptide (TPR) repeat protein
MHQNLGWANLVLGRHKEALENILKCRAAWPDDKACLRCQIIILAEMGRLNEAHALVRKLLQEMPYFTVAWYRDNIFGSAKDESLRNRMLDGMRKAGVPEK